MEPRRERCVGIHKARHRALEHAQRVMADGEKLWVEAGKLKAQRVVDSTKRMADEVVASR